MSARWLLALALVTGTAAAAAAVDGTAPKDVPYEPTRGPNVGFEPPDGAQLPLDLPLVAEDGSAVTLGAAAAGKPTILVLAYYRCPVMCTEVLNGLVDALRVIPEYTAGREFNVVVVSFDPKERNELGLVRAKKAEYLKGYGRAGADWRFLTGTKESVAALCATVGFKYEFDKQFKEYNHPSGIMVLTPSGKLSRSFSRIEFRDKDADGRVKTPPAATTLRLTLVEAGEGKIGTLADKVRLYCYRFDHLNKGYSLRVMRVVRAAGAVTVLALVGGFVVLSRRHRARPAAAAPAPDTVPTGVDR